MLAIDSLLQLAHREGATEVRIGTDRAPSMSGSKRQLSMPVTPDDMVRHLIGGLLTEANEARLARNETVELRHDVPQVGPTRAQLRRRDDGGLDASFQLVRAYAPPEEPDASPAPTAPRAASPQRASRAPQRDAPAPRPPATNARSLDAVRDDSSALDADAAPATRDDTHALETDPAREPSARLAALWAAARAQGASDLHACEGEAPTLRVHGALDRLAPPHDEALEASELASLLTPREQAQIASGRSADFVVRDATLGVRIRVNAYRTSRGLALACRFLPGIPPTLEALGARALADLATMPNGLIVVTGPTGSGKSSTLAALARTLMASRSVVLVSLEDPIEFELDPRALHADEAEGGDGPWRSRARTRGVTSLVRQRQIGRDVRDFATGLRDALREDPDVLVVGEMRDAESVALAITAAETGHLVLATLHARSAASAIDRILDTQPDAHKGLLRAQLADSLRAVVAQRLVPKAHGGRVLALEILRATPAVASALREGRPGAAVSAMQTGRQNGMVTLERTLADLVRQGTVTLDDAEAHANDRDMLHRHLGAHAS